MTRPEKTLTEWMERRDAEAGYVETLIAFGEDEIPRPGALILADLDRATVRTLSDWLFALRADDGCDAVQTLRAFFADIETQQIELDRLTRECPEPGVVS